MLVTYYYIRHPIHGVIVAISSHLIMTGNYHVIVTATKHSSRLDTFFFFFFSKPKLLICLLFDCKNVHCDNRLKRLAEVRPLSTHNLWFCGEIRKNIMWIPLLIWGYDKRMH